MMNVGYVEGSLDDGDVVVRVYYDATVLPPGPDQPLINGPRGFCLDLTNKSGRTAWLTMSGLTGNPLTLQLGQGDPVTSGPLPGRSRTAAQLAALGFTARGSLGDFQVG